MTEPQAARETPDYHPRDYRKCLCTSWAEHRDIIEEARTVAAREITFSGTVVGWPDEGQRITVEVGRDCNEYPAIGESVRVVRHQAAQETMRTSTEGSNDARNETLDPDPAARETHCGAPANGGPCVEPRGHNMGRADVPDNHRAARETLRPDPRNRSGISLWRATNG